jgi:hypothetical protein
MDRKSWLQLLLLGFVSLAVAQVGAVRIGPIRLISAPATDIKPR